MHPRSGAGIPGFSRIRITGPATTDRNAPLRAAPAPFGALADRPATAIGVDDSSRCRTQADGRGFRVRVSLSIPDERDELGITDTGIITAVDPTLPKGSRIKF